MENQDSQYRNKRAKEFKAAAQKMVDFLNKYGCPHDTVIVDQAHAEMLCGEIAVPFEPLD